MFIVDANKIHNISMEFGVVSTPAVVVFFRGSPVRIQRSGWEEDLKCNRDLDVGVTSHENYIKLLAAARLNAHKGVVSCD